MLIINPDIESYIEGFCEPEDLVLQELTRETHLKTVHPRMLSGNFQGRCLQMLTKMINPSTVLEIGTFTGYSAICIARSLRQGATLHTIEINDELEPICRKYFTKAGVESKINLIFGNAMELIPVLNLKFDMIFLDAEKSDYPDFYRLINKIVSPGTYLLADNVLWDGKILDADDSADKMTRGVKEFNRLIGEDHSYEKIILPVRDGIMLARKK